jgi:ParB family chromosome partitioning protein
MLLMKKASGLGKGLSALISERKMDIETYAENAGKRAELTVSELFPGRFQPRTIFNAADMEELAESIRRNGVIQPVLVRKRVGQGYEIIAGERRWRASKSAGLKKIPAIILEVEDRQAMEIALIENIQRQNLTILEEAEGYKKLIKEFEYTQEQLADVIGKSRSHVTNILRLLSLPEDVKTYLNDGSLTTGHARAILAAPEPVSAANEVIRKNLSVRQTEDLVKKLAESKGESKKPKNYVRKKKGGDISSDPAENDAVVQHDKEPEIIMMEQQLVKQLGLKVSINNDDESGEVVIQYGSMEDLEKIISKLES